MSKCEYTKSHYLTQKRLLDMAADTQVEIPYKKALYTSIKSLASQLKGKGLGIWHVHKGTIGTIVIREK